VDGLIVLAGPGGVKELVGGPRRNARRAIAWIRLLA
jgi:hypothetical protein